MKSVNKVILIGAVGTDPNIRISSNGIASGRFTLATNKKFKDRDGDIKIETEWHNIVVFRRNAEFAGEYIRKGDKLYIEGSIKSKVYTDKNNIEKRMTEIICNEINKLSRKSDESMHNEKEIDGNKVYSFEEDELPF